MSRLDLLKNARHDLGKYVAMQCRWADGPDLAEALASDVLHTHRSSAGSTSAVMLWQRLRPELVAAEPEAPELVAIDGLMATLAVFVACDGQQDEPALVATRDAAIAVADTLRAWVQRVQSEAKPWPRS